MWWKDDGQLPNELEKDADMPSKPKHFYNLRPKQKRSCSPAKRAAPPPKTVPRPPSLIEMPHIDKSEYENIRDANIAERQVEFLRIFGYPMNMD